MNNAMWLNVAIGLTSAVVFRSISNAAYQATLPQVDPEMPSAGPVLAAAAIPGAIGGVAAWKKYPKVASAFLGIAAGSAISTAEYMAYAKGAQMPATLPDKAHYYWVLVHKDASLEQWGAGQYNLAELAAKDNAVVNKYGNDPDIIQISRKNPDGSTATLATTGFGQGVQGIAIGEPSPGRQAGAAMRLGPRMGIGVPQGAGAMRIR